MGNVFRSHQSRQGRFQKMNAVFILGLSLFVLTGCNQKLNNLNSAMNVNSIPDTYENPRDKDNNPDLNLHADEKEQTEPSQPTSNEADSKPDDKDKKDQTQTHRPPYKLNEPLGATASKLMQSAQYIMVTEGKKIGTACNLYIRRVLEYAGFSGEGFLATDFDLYAKKHFKYYRATDFKQDPHHTETARLRQYIWSYPERTPFILQWSRSGVIGHIAIMERIEDTLVIYQASLGSYTARKNKTTPEILLNDYNRRVLTVYSEMSAD